MLLGDRIGLDCLDHFQQTLQLFGQTVLVSLLILGYVQNPICTKEEHMFSGTLSTQTVLAVTEVTSHVGTFCDDDDGWVVEVVIET